MATRASRWSSSRAASPSLDDILARAAERGEPPFVLVLDSLEDPHNVGSLLRSAEAAGVHGVVFPTHRQAPLSPSAVKASAGAVEHLLLHARPTTCPATLSDLHARGLRIAGADGDAPLTARQTDLRGPLAIVVGSEGQGLGPAVRRRCDVFMRIPMKGAVGSLNAAVAGSILLFEALAAARGRSPPPPPAPAESGGLDRRAATTAGRRSAVPTPRPRSPGTPRTSEDRRRERRRETVAPEPTREATRPPAARRRRASPPSEPADDDLLPSATRRRSRPRRPTPAARPTRSRSDSRSHPARTPHA